MQSMKNADSVYDTFCSWSYATVLGLEIQQF